MTAERYVLVRLLGAERESALFDAADVAIAVGEHCVVDHGGLALGVVERELAADESLRGQLEHVVRAATPADIEAHQYNQADAERAIRTTREAVTRHALPMHLVAAVFSLDRKLLRIYFTAPHRVDFRELLRDLASRFGARIDLRQMGARDEARLRGGLGRCGIEICCHRFLREPKPIPMEYAYDQELFVSPERITGLCGRLICCLAYERETYLAELAELPKLGAHVTTQGKQGKVIAHSVFHKTVTVLTEDRDRITLDAADVALAPPPHER